MKKHICFISPFASPLFSKDNGGTGGAEKQFYLFGNHLAKEGYSISYILEDSPTNINCNWAKLNKVDLSFLGGNKLKILNSFIQFIVALIRNKADIVILKTPTILFLPIYIYTVLFQKHFFFWGQTDTDFNRKKPNENFLIKKCRYLGIKKASSIIVQNNFQKKQLLNNFKRESILISNIIEPEDSLKHKTDEIIILWVGNSSINKGFEDLLTLAKHFYKCKFVVAMNVSDQTLFNEYKLICNSISNINFIGSVTNIELKEYYKKAYLLLNTSKREGFPNTFLEAWSFGVPVVSLKIDPNSVISNKGLGFCAETFNKDERFEKFTSKLHDVITTHKEYEIMSKNCLNYVKKNHYPKVVVSKLVSLIKFI